MATAFCCFFLFFTALVASDDGAWVFVRAFVSGPRLYARRDYCVWQIPSAKIEPSGQTVSFLRTTRVRRYTYYDFWAKGAGFAGVLMGDGFVNNGSFGCATEAQISALHLKRKMVVYQQLCADEDETKCFPCRDKLEIVRELKRVGAKAVLFWARIDPRRFHAAAVKWRERGDALHVSVPDGAYFDMFVADAEEADGAHDAEFFRHDFFDDLKEKGVFGDSRQVRFFFWVYVSPRDANKITALVLLAVLALSVCCACAVAASNVVIDEITRRDAKRATRKKTKSEKKHHSAGGKRRRCSAAAIDVAASFFALIIVVGFLLIVYFFSDYVIPILCVLYAIGAVLLVRLFRPLIRRVPCGDARLTPRGIDRSDAPSEEAGPCSFEIRELIAGLCFLALGFVWYVFRRHLLYIFLLHILIGIGFIFAVTVTVASSMGETTRYTYIFVLSVLLFFYDVFMVFITPLFTKDHQSVMVSVAKGGTSGDQIPFEFYMPEFFVTMETECRGRTFASILGFGDVIVPCLVMFVVRAFAMRTADPKAPSTATCCPSTVYAVSVAVAYAAALATTMIVLMILRMPQPALLYIVPFVHVTVTCVAGCRGELKNLWTKDLSVELEKDDAGGGDDHEDDDDDAKLIPGGS